MHHSAGLKNLFLNVHSIQFLYHPACYPFTPESGLSSVLAVWYDRNQATPSGSPGPTGRKQSFGTISGSGVLARQLGAPHRKADSLASVYRHVQHNSRLQLFPRTPSLSFCLLLPSVVSNTWHGRTRAPITTPCLIHTAHTQAHAKPPFGACCPSPHPQLLPQLHFRPYRWT